MCDNLTQLHQLRLRSLGENSQLDRRSGVTRVPGMFAKERSAWVRATDRYLSLPRVASRILFGSLCRCALRMQPRSRARVCETRLRGRVRCSVPDNHSNIARTIMPLWHSGYHAIADFNEEQSRVRQIRCLAILIAFNAPASQKFVTVAPGLETEIHGIPCIGRCATLTGDTVRRQI